MAVASGRDNDHHSYEGELPWWPTEDCGPQPDQENKRSSPTIAKSVVNGDGGEATNTPSSEERSPKTLTQDSNHQCFKLWAAHGNGGGVCLSI